MAVLVADATCLTSRELSRSDSAFADVRHYRKAMLAPEFIAVTLQP
jgi:hypothetical protein